MLEEELRNKSDRELLVQLRITMAVLEERTEGIQEISSRLQRVEGDLSWMKRILWSAVPVGPVLAGGAALLTKLLT